MEQILCYLGRSAENAVLSCCNIDKGINTLAIRNFYKTEGNVQI